MTSANRPSSHETITRSGETSRSWEQTTRSRSFSEEKTAPARDRPNAREPETPIGIFDSGVGGLTVARAVLDQLPAERIRYVGDTAHAPYGPLPIARVREHAMAVTDELVASGVKLLVLACNTASAAGLRDARERYGVPVVEVIIPAVRRAVHTTRSGRIGVIGTEGTIRSRAYEDAFAAARDVRVTSVACPQFADFVERGITSGRQVLGLAQAYLEPLHRADVDTVVLGCTHYPLLTGVIQLVMGDSVTLVSSAEETAKDVLRVLTELDLLASPGLSAPVHEFHSTGPAQPFAKLAERFLGPSVPAIRDSLASWPPSLVPS
jgi:glutamate racemase